MDNLIKFSSRTPRYIGLDYLQSNGGGERIDTNYVPLATYFKVDLNFSIYSYSSWDGVFGAGASSSGGKYNFECTVQSDQKNIRLYNGTGYKYAEAPFVFDTIYNYTFLADNGTQSISDGSGVISTSTYSGTIRALGNLHFNLFVNTGDGSNFWGSYLKLYSCKMYSDDTTLVRDYIPVKRYSDGVLGLYDKVENKFYANAGTGAFTAGKENAKNNIY